jgi:serine/threonine protein kinase
MEPGEMVGQKLGHYYITGVIGRGGMATVFLAQDTYLKREVALKVFRSRSDAQDVFLRRFEREAQVVAQLEHPNILLVYEYGRYEGKAYFAMPYLSYGSLRSYLQTQRKLSARAAVELLIPVLRALQYAHDRGLIHRDIKPDNLLFKADHSLVLSDFGLVKVLTDEYDTTALSSFVTHTTSIMGTPQYMSPEQIQGRAVPASDIYSLGVVLYELLTGTVPFVAESAIRVMTMHLYEYPRSLRAIHPTISQELEDVVLKSLEKDARRRYQHPRDFLQALLDAMRIDPASAVNETPEERNPVRPASRPLSSSIMTANDAALANDAGSYVVDNDSFAELHIPTQVSRQTQLSTAVLPATLARSTTQRQPQQQPSASRFVSLVFLIGLLALVPLGILWSLPILLPAHNRLPAVASGCPATDQARSAVLIPQAAATQNQDQTLVYVQQIRVPSGSAEALIRYDADTEQASTLKILANVNISSAQISPDGEWIVFVASSARQSRLQLLRVDGRLLQTLYCAPTSNPTDPSIQAIHWSPYTYSDSERLLFTIAHNTQIEQLSLGDGTLHQELRISADDQIVGWHDAQHIYLRKASAGSDLYQAALSNGKTASKSSLQVVVPAGGASCDAYAIGPQAVTYISHCGGKPANCQECGNNLSGASSISILGSKQPFFSNQTMALAQICSTQNTLLALSIAAHPTASVPNGLWSIDTQKMSPQPKLLAQIDVNQYQPSFNASSQASWSNVSRNNRFYSITLQPVKKTGSTMLALGSLTGGKPKTIASQPSGSNLSLVGWTAA